MEASSKRKFAEMHESIPDDVYEAALAASQQDSDGEDPFGPQPKRFMQTEHQQRRQKRDLYIRQVAFMLREKRKDQSSQFRKLPPELILKLMQHVDLSSLLDLASSSEITRCIFRANEKAVYRGIEIEQFSDWKWLFGNTVHRTAAQVQHLKDAISVEYCFGATGLACEERLLELLRTIDNKMFTGMQNVKFLQDMQGRVDTDIEAIESYTTKQVARRTAICLRSLSFRRPVVVKEDDRDENGPLVHCLTSPWEARSELIVEQPASIQAEIRSLLMIAIQKLYSPLQDILTCWTHRYYNNPGNHRKPREVKKWMSKVVTGLILQDMVPQWYSDTVGSSIKLSLEQSILEVSNHLVWLLNVHDKGIVDVLEEVEDALQFGRSIGIDLEGLVEGTPVGNLVESLGPNDETMPNPPWAALINRVTVAKV